MTELTDEQVWAIFNHRCIVCFEYATDLNHIIPRSRGKTHKYNWRNKVPLCKKHHDAFHHKGVTAEKIIYMQDRRIEVLHMLGRQQYD